jgi:hypothetical protein
MQKPGPGHARVVFRLLLISLQCDSSTSNNEILQHVASLITVKLTTSNQESNRTLCVRVPCLSSAGVLREKAIANEKIAGGRWRTNAGNPALMVAFLAQMHRQSSSSNTAVDILSLSIILAELV